MAIVALGMVVTPGPNMIYLVSRSIAQGPRAGLMSLTGTAAGFMVYLTATCFGLTAVFALVPAAYTVIKIAGACYLLYLAWNAIKPGGTSVFEPRTLSPDTPRRLFTMGLVTNLLNPKAAILYLSLLPQFVEPGRGDVMLQSLLLGATQIAISAAVNTVIIISAGGLSAFLAKRPTWLRIQRYATGTLLGTFAVRMAADRSKAVLAA